MQGDADPGDARPHTKSQKFLPQGRVIWHAQVRASCGAPPSQNTPVSYTGCNMHLVASRCVSGCHPTLREESPKLMFITVPFTTQGMENCRIHTSRVSGWVIRIPKGCGWSVAHMQPPRGNAAATRQCSRHAQSNAVRRSYTPPHTVVAISRFSEGNGPPWQAINGSQLEIPDGCAPYRRASYI